MKVLQVVHGFPLKKRSGTEIYTYYLSKKLAKRHEVHVLYPVFKNIKKEPIITSVCRDRIFLHELKFPKNNKIKQFWRLLFLKTYMDNKNLKNAFIELLKKIKPDIIHFQHLVTLSPTFIEIAKELNIPTVLTLHDYWFMCPNIYLLRYDYTLCEGPKPNKCYKCWTKKQLEELSNALSKLYIPKFLTKTSLELLLKTFNTPNDFKTRQEYFKYLLLSVDKIIAPSKFLKELFVNYGIPEDKIIYSENGYNLNVFRGFKKKEKNTDKIVFGFAGNVIPIKGVHVLIDAFLRVPEDIAELKIYGSYNSKSYYIKKLFSKIKERNNIHFMGKYDDPKTPFSEIDVLIFPSICYENCPLVLAEARATKTPVIASNLGAIPEFVEEGKTGLLFRPNNPKDLYEKLMKIIENPELIEKFKSNIKPPTSIEKQAKEIEKIYNEVISKRLETV